MAQKSRPTFKKRQREMARQQRQQDKMAQRLEKKARPDLEGEPTGGDEDPDIAGIRPGPQPLPQEWLGPLTEVKPEESPE